MLNFCCFSGSFYKNIFYFCVLLIENHLLLLPEKARLQAEAKAAEDARRQAEAEAAAEAAAEAKRKRELEREAARQALLKVNSKQMTYITGSQTLNNTQ